MSTFGKILFGLSAVIMYLLAAYSYFVWFGILGGIASLVIPPLYILFPIVYAFTVGISPGFLVIIIIWLINILSIFMIKSGMKENKTSQDA